MSALLREAGWGNNGTIFVYRTYWETRGGTRTRATPQEVQATRLSATGDTSRGDRREAGLGP